MVTIDAIGKRWNIEILLALSKESKRFNQLMKLQSDSNKKMNSRTLTNRLKKLEKEELIAREIIDERPPSTIYKITEKGKKTLELLKKLNNL